MVLEYEPEFEELVAEAACFFLEVDGLLVPFFVAEDGLRFKSGNSALVWFDLITTESQARRLAGIPVYLFESEIAKTFEENPAPGFFGYSLFDENANEIGIVTAVDDYSGNVVITLDAFGKEVLVPFNEDLLIELDDEKKIIRLRLPDGLLE
jgi:16S rRNA processing protein RimM